MPLGMALAGLAFDLSGKSVPLMFGVSAVAMLCITVAPIALSRGYLGFLSTEAPAASGTEAAAEPLGSEPEDVPLEG